MIAVLGGLADAERDIICTRTAEGRSRAKVRGSLWADPRLSRKRPPDDAQGATLQDLADSYDRSISTMRRNTRAA